MCGAHPELGHPVPWNHQCPVRRVVNSGMGMGGFTKELQRSMTPLHQRNNSHFNNVVCFGFRPVVSRSRQMNMSLVYSNPINSSKRKAVSTGPGQASGWNCMERKGAFVAQSFYRSVVGVFKPYFPVFG